MRAGELGVELLADRRGEARVAAVDRHLDAAGVARARRRGEGGARRGEGEVQRRYEAEAEAQRGAHAART